jgi:hypothetical protein
MKDRAQVQFAVEVAIPFADIKYDADDTETKLLKSVLSSEEYKVYEQLADPVDGPFAGVWKSGSYRWDGVEEARNFWKQVEVAELPSWQASR